MLRLHSNNGGSLLSNNIHPSTYIHNSPSASLYPCKQHHPPRPARHLFKTNPNATKAGVKSLQQPNRSVTPPPRRSLSPSAKPLPHPPPSTSTRFYAAYSSTPFLLDILATSFCPVNPPIVPIHPRGMLRSLFIFALALLVEQGARAQGDLSATNNVTGLAGTWSSNPSVSTGGVSAASTG